MQPTFFINHGGGPCFFIERGQPMRDNWASLETYLRGFAARLETRPDAIVIVSGHWEETVPTVNAAPSPNLLFDYYNFPPHTYELRYPAPGAPALAERVRTLLCAAGIDSAAETKRGWDHGVFIPLMVMFPDADIPVVQVSMPNDYDPAKHIALGRALAPLRAENVLIIGSGQSYHNMRGFFRSTPDAGAVTFDDWLAERVPDPARREAALLGWAKAPGARDAQPEEDHFLPLMVAAGAALDAPGVVDFRGSAGAQPVIGFRFGWAEART